MADDAIRAEVADRLTRAGENGVLRVITCGSVDDGKSTLIGRLLYDTKLIFEDQLAALERDSRKHGTVGEDIDLALLVDADGVHLGQDDLPTNAARRLIGDGRLLGRSTHNLAQLQAAHQDDCDYLGVGPIYATGTKPEKVPQGLDWARQASEHATLPWFAIGGIQADRLPELGNAGVRRVAVVGAIMAAADPAAASRELLNGLAVTR